MQRNDVSNNTTPWQQRLQYSPPRLSAVIGGLEGAPARGPPRSQHPHPWSPTKQQDQALGGQGLQDRAQASRAGAGDILLGDS